MTNDLRGTWPKTLLQGLIGGMAFLLAGVLARPLTQDHGVLISLGFFLAALFGLLVIPLAAFIWSQTLNVSAGNAYLALWSSLPVLSLYAALPQVEPGFRKWVFVLIGILYSLVALFRLGRFKAARAFSIVFIFCVCPFSIIQSFEGPSFSNLDDFANVFTSLNYLASGLAAGELPLWNNANWLGHPFGADPMWGAWYPLNLGFAYLVGLSAKLINAPFLDVVWRDLFFYYRFCIALTCITGMYQMFRASGFSRVPSLAGCLIFPMSTYIQIQFLWTFCLVPWWYFGILKMAEVRSLQWALFTGLIAGFALLGGQMQGIAYFGYVLLAVGVFHLWESRGRLTAEQRSEQLRWAAISLLITLTIAVFYWLPARQYVAVALRWISDGPIKGPSRLMFSDTLVGSFSSWTEAWKSFYGKVGLPFLVLAIVGIYRPTRQYVVHLGLILVFAIASVGALTPLHWVLYKVLPLWASFRLVSRCEWVVLFCLSFFVVRGAERLLSGRLRVPLTLGLLAVCGWMMAQKADYWRAAQSTEYPSPSELSEARELDQFFRTQAGPFRIDLRSDQLHLYFGFLFGHETVNGYGGLALESGAEIVWYGPPASKNLRFRVFQKSKITDEAPPAGELRFATSSFNVYELPDFAPRFYWSGEPLDTSGITIAANRRNSLELLVRSESERNLIMAVPYYRNWVATLDGKRLKIEKQNDLMSVKVPVSKDPVLLKLVYRDPVQFVLGGVILAFWALFLATLMYPVRMEALLGRLIKRPSSL